MLLPLFVVVALVGLALLIRHARRVGTGVDARLSTGRRRWLQVVLTVGNVLLAVGLVYVLGDAAERDDLFDGIPMLVGGGILAVGLLLGLAAGAELRAHGSRAAQRGRSGQLAVVVVAVAAVAYHQLGG